MRVGARPEQQSQAERPLPRVVLVGGGFAGVHALRHLRRLLPPGRATSIDLTARTMSVLGHDGGVRSQRWDRLVLAPGSVTDASTSLAWPSTRMG